MTITITRFCRLKCLKNNTIRFLIHFFCLVGINNTFSKITFNEIIYNDFWFMIGIYESYFFNDELRLHLKTKIVAITH